MLFSTSHPERITEMVQKPFAVEILRPAREEIAEMPLSGRSPACDSNEIVRFKITMRRSLPGHEGPARPIRRRAENPLHLQLNPLMRASRSFRATVGKGKVSPEAVVYCAVWIRGVRSEGPLRKLGSV